MAKIIKTEKEYTLALRELEQLMDDDPMEGTPDANRLELLTVLLRDYESKNVNLPPPDPIEAILFRMEQQNLKQSDLVPYIGSRSKVSEVISRKRPLSLSMIRALHAGLGIPAAVLLQGKEVLRTEMDLEWSRFPIREMVRRGWIQTPSHESQTNAESLLKEFCAPLGFDGMLSVLYKRSRQLRGTHTTDEYALAAWTARISNRAAREPISTDLYDPSTITLKFMREIVKLSWSESGPKLAQEYLAHHGIPLIIEPHLPGTYLDGAAIIMRDNRPIIALTLRHDRIDNFWFSLMHELSHIALHVQSGFKTFFDDLDCATELDEIEREADAYASEALIPQEEWKKSPASRLKSPDAAEHLAKQLGIHPAIVAGRMRREFNAYQLLNHLIGHRQVRKLFSNVMWNYE